jgi:transposase
MDRSERRRKSKDDDLDAISVARAALHGRRASTPKSNDGASESLRVLRVTAAAVRAWRRPTAAAAHDYPRRLAPPLAGSPMA